MQEVRTTPDLVTGKGILEVLAMVDISKNLLPKGVVILHIYIYIHISITGRKLWNTWDILKLFPIVGV